MRRSATMAPVVDWILAELRALRAAYDFDIAAAVPRDKLTARPDGADNSIAWIVWHLARMEDVAINAVVRGGQQVLETDGWGARMSVADMRTGTGFAPSDVRGIEQILDVDGLDGYWTAVRRATISWLETAPSLDEVPDATSRLAAIPAIVPSEGGWIHEEWMGKPARYFVRTVVIAHGYLHLGEMRSVRSRLGINGL
jgi:hypothetical protein